MVTPAKTVGQQTPAANVVRSPDRAVGTPTTTIIGVGIDTSRYDHCVAFLNDQLQTAAPELQVVESAAGYAHLRQRFVKLVQ